MMQSNTNEFKANPAVNAEGGAGSQRVCVDTGAEALITMRCGQNAADVFKAAGMKIYKAIVPTHQENLKPKRRET